ncbi:MAG TPA: DUF4386 family protein [Devosiaceae bacterium]
MSTLHKWGVLSAFAAAATYVFGFALLFTALAPSGYGMADADPARIVAFIAANTGLITVWNLVIYVVNGFLLAILAIVFADRFKPLAPALGQAALVFGVLWATLVVAAGMIGNVGNAAVVAHYAQNPDEAVLMWTIFHTVENGLGGGNEIAGGMWALVLGTAMIRTGLLPRPLGWFSLIIGAAGLLTIIPPASDIAGAVFGLGYIGWFIWVGVAFARNRA